ncbi:hypothetical protein Tco_1359769 [Tanacetum coccineum]
MSSGFHVRRWEIVSFARGSCLLEKSLNLVNTESVIYPPLFDFVAAADGGSAALVVAAAAGWFNLGNYRERMWLLYVAWMPSPGPSTIKSHSSGNFFTTSHSPETSSTTKVILRDVHQESGRQSAQIVSKFLVKA